MSAAIIPLPGAAAVQVVRSKLPRGRPPANVSSLRRGKQIRAIRESWVTHANGLEARARELRGMAQNNAAFCLPEAARLEAEALALRGTSR